MTSLSDISSFLKKLAESIDLNKLSAVQLQYTKDFYTQMKINSEIDETTEIKDCDIMKYFTLGWYMYQIMLNK